MVKRGRVLLVEQQKGARRYWLLPGGGVQRGESLVEALAREVNEECGLHVEVLTPPLAVVETISPDAGRSRHLVHLVFAARATGLDEPSPGDATVRDARWFGPEELGELVIHPPLHDLLARWLESSPDEMTRPLPPQAWGGVRWVH